MTDLMDLDPAIGEFTLRKPDGTVVFRASDRMPHILDRATGTVTLDWDYGYQATAPQAIAPQAHTYYGNNVWHHTVAQFVHLKEVTLKAYTGVIPPTFWWGAIKLTRTVQGRLGEQSFQLAVRPNAWLQYFGGSVLIEDHAESFVIPQPTNRIVTRAINFAVSGGNVVCEMHQSSRAALSSYVSPYGAFAPDMIGRNIRSVWTLEYDVSYGIFDL